jgi:N-acylglucosamine 2-epimerase
MNRSEQQSLLADYRRHLEETLLPFWMNRALDTERGGVYTCFSNDGTRLVSTDKYSWSQGRFVWLLARLADDARKGLVSGDADVYLAHAARTVHFLSEHVFLDNGNCAYLLTEKGEKKEAFPGGGHDISLFVDCFVAMGFAEFGRVAGDPDAVSRALRLFDRLEERIAEGDLRAEPYTLPAEYKSHSIPMIMLNVAQTVRDALASTGHPREAEMSERCVEYVRQLLETIRQPDDTMREVLYADGRLDTEWRVGRHLNPGHTLECMWFVLHEAKWRERTDWIEAAARIARKAYDIGWDEKYGGLLHYVDCDGGPPKGTDKGTAFDRNVAETWDSKLWWIHSEALYTSLLTYRLTGEKDFWALHRKTRDYTFRTFPNPDKSVGEWIQIRDREGRPLDRVVALPVKDPYHIIRNMLLLIELLAEA